MKNNSIRDFCRYTFYVILKNNEYNIHCKEFPYCVGKDSDRKNAFEMLYGQMNDRINLILSSFENHPIPGQTLRRTRFSGLFRQVWSSPCSNHYYFSHACNTCSKGNWIFKRK